MKRLTALLLALVLTLLAAACGSQPGPGNQNTGGQTAQENTLPENPAVEPIPQPEPEPVQEPYEILDPTVMPEGGVRDGVAGVAHGGKPLAAPCRSGIAVGRGRLAG